MLLQRENEFDTNLVNSDNQESSGITLTLLGLYKLSFSCNSIFFGLPDIT